MKLILVNCKCFFKAGSFGAVSQNIVGYAAGAGLRVCPV